MLCSPPGLSLIFGVMRLVNIAHGDLIVAASYLAWAIVHATGLSSAGEPRHRAAGRGRLSAMALQLAVLNHTLGKDILPPLLVTFGLSVILQNGLLQIFTADTRKLDAGALETGSFSLLPGVAIGYFPLLMFATAVVVIAGLQYLFYNTGLGRAFRATSDDREIALLMGLDNKQVYASAMALSLAVVALAGVFLAIRSNFDPFMGPGRLIFGFEAVIIGGLGNLWGTLVGRRDPRRRAGRRRGDQSRLAVARRPSSPSSSCSRSSRAACSRGCSEMSALVSRATRASRIAGLVALGWSRRWSRGPWWS